jgi:hypothetical protein
MTIETKDIIAFSGIGITLVVSLIGLYVSLRNTKKTLFINSITSSRIKWIELVRKNISDYCGLIYHFTLTGLDSPERQKVLEQVDKLRFLIKLQLNREDKFDRKIIDKINLIPDLTASNKFEQLTKEMNELVELTQDLLKLEWEGAKLESMKGVLTQKQKDKLYEKYLRTKKHRLRS